MTMTPDELIAARTQLQLTRAELGIDLGLSEVTVERWENGADPIPKSYAQRIAWHAALTARDAALASSGLPECEWIAVLAAKPVANTKEMLRRADEATKHATGCSVCIARQRYVDNHLPPLPEPPLSPTMRAIAWIAERIGKLPAWARPAAVGALLVGAIVIFRVLVASASGGFSLHLLGQGAMAIGAGAYLGAIGGVAYTLVRAPFRKLGRLGDYLTGIVCVSAYFTALALPAAVISNDPMLREPSTWVVFPVLAVLFGVVIGHWWFRET